MIDESPADQMHKEQIYEGIKGKKITIAYC